MEIDWSKVKEGTPIHIMVMGSSQLAYFVGFENGVITFRNTPTGVQCHDFRAEYVTLAKED